MCLISHWSFDNIDIPINLSSSAGAQRLHMDLHPSYTDISTMHTQGSRFCKQEC